ncbi:FadR/GntR family transcriptional regulator [Nocardioides bruguierae]|uniref:FCD domain-containing protein n=1 Tax=Nocardioides bruguierae TaxID=2945102 RepID=A0A9X2IHD0_9ACTN|nr:FCD domain-containing protein [Nocardioides bruguierae]MCL8026086.1 FCD domain-containing protein [Nocardioides bruguierae]MCM0622479.1 FCD domain-containing protein [Nocardioides bruguierae]
MESRPASGALHASVLDAVGAAVVSGELAAGSVLTLEGISRSHDISVSMAREVVRVLQHLGLVESRRRVGITVRPSSGWSVFDPRVIRWRLAGSGRAAQLASLSELRRGFEPVAAALAAERATAEQVAALAGAVHDMAVHGRAQRLDDYLVADTVFHRTLLEASGNEMLAALADVVGELLAGRTEHDLMPSRPNPDAVRLHEDVARAVRDGDATAAQQAMTAIITEATDALVAQLSAD